MPGTDYQRETSVNISRAGAAEHMNPCKDALDYVKEYAREKPDVAALWCFGIGFVLGWKLKPW